MGGSVKDAYTDKKRREKERRKQKRKEKAQHMEESESWNEVEFHIQQKRYSVWAKSDEGTNTVRAYIGDIVLDKNWVETVENEDNVYNHIVKQLEKTVWIDEVRKSLPA